ncbi:MAG: ABC transporter substrate-binding protein [Chloroflexota bacterium]|nr:ABC transporter substrate-binding protein [Chloroflexota bacterium]
MEVGMGQFRNGMPRAARRLIPLALFLFLIGILGASCAYGGAGTMPAPSQEQAATEEKEAPADSAKSEEPATRTVIDDTQRPVVIPSGPLRIAVTDAWMVELLMACGHTPVARPQIPDEHIYPAAAKDIPEIAISHSAGPNLEQLAAVQPDIVLTSSTFGRFAGPIAAALRIPVLIFNVNSIEGILEKMDTLGTLAGCEDEAQNAKSELEERIAEQQQDLPDEGPVVFGVFGTSESFLAFTGQSYLGNMVEHLRGRLTTEGDPPYMYRGIPDPAYTPFSLEIVVERDPDVILVVRHGGPSEAREGNFDSLYANPAWAGLRAVQEERIYELSEWLYMQYPGPRVIQAMEELRPLLYPDAQE